MDELASDRAGNVAGDAGTEIWESKYTQVWRGHRVRDATPRTGPRARRTATRPRGDPGLHSARRSGEQPHRPKFRRPSRPTSGHAGFGGALFQILRRFYGTYDIPFTFISDELNRETLDREGTARPMMPRTFTSLSQAEEENGQSRIYLGIHWSFDKTEGIAQGRRVADWVFDMRSSRAGAASPRLTRASIPPEQSGELSRRARAARARGGGIPVHRWWRRRAVGRPRSR